MRHTEQYKRILRLMTFAMAGFAITTAVVSRHAGAQMADAAQRLEVLIEMRDVVSNSGNLTLATHPTEIDL